MVPLPPLDSPQTLLWTRLPSVARLNTRGPQGRSVLQGHMLDRSGAFRSDGGERPAQNGRALLCAADNAKSIQGSSATYKLKDARNRAPVTPVSLHISDVSAQRKGWGVKRGRETLVSLPLLFSPVNTGPPGRRRRPKTPRWGISSPSASKMQEPAKTLICACA